LFCFAHAVTSLRVRNVVEAAGGVRERAADRYRTSEPNSPSFTRVRIFIFGRTTAKVRMIYPRWLIVMV